MTDEELIIGLAGTNDARLRFALSGLLLMHPELADVFSAVIDSRHIRFVPKNILAEIQKHYLAALYLQRMWRTRLRLTFGDSPLIPERFIEELKLPHADAMHGELGLHHLTNGSVFNDWSSYQQVVDLLCEQPCAADGLIALG